LDIADIVAHRSPEVSREHDSRFVLLNSSGSQGNPEKKKG
jgi:hypothetical protein